MARHCDKYLNLSYPDLPEHFIESAVEKSTTIKARLLHYFPRSSEEAEANIDSWCGLHIDHSLLTGLTSAMYIDDSSKDQMKVVTAEDPKDGHFLKDGGLYIKSRDDTLTKVDIPYDCLAFQIGEASQVASRGLLVATPHLVRSIKDAPHLSRNTFAVFLQPNIDHKLTPELDFDEFTKQVMQRHY